MAENKSQFAKNEEEILDFWKKNKIFQKTLQKDAPKGNFVFFEGPPTANGRPGIHHVLARAFKDVIPRFKTMQGYHVDRKAGWDTHGLPVELQVEKELEISGKPDIEKYGVEEFNKKCKQSVWQYKEEWERLTERIAFWVDMDNPYITYNNEYIESLWWILKQVNEKGLLYKGYKVVPHCPRCGTALSSHEVAQGYKNVEENSVYMKFKVKGEDNTYILSWTTTPWTLPGNVALAVGEEIDYVKVKVDNEFWYLAKALVNDVFENEVEVVEQIKGSELIGKEYESLFPNAIPKDTENYENGFKVYAADFVTTEDGTGVVHTAVLYGEDDYQLGEKVGLPKFHTVGEDGKFLETVEKWAGKFVKNKTVEKEIVEDLKERGLLYKEKMYEHDYPFCWRCDSPLLYYANDSWFIKMSQLKEQLIANNQEINWVPDYIKNGRFGEWLENVKDWAISRQRYWGTPIPVWECDKCNKLEVIGSMSEFEEKFGSLPKDKEGNLDLHKPFIDEMKYDCECGGQMVRTADVFDCWYDSGSMPFAQHHYPFEKKELIDSGEQFPAEYICEAIDQTRGWFYLLLAVSTVLEKGAPYKNVICLGHIRDSEGKKMSKSKGNVVDPWLVADKYGIDALRMQLYSMNQPGDPKNFDEKQTQEVLRKVVMLLGNVVNFYEMYADKDVELGLVKLNAENVLDKWIITKLNLLIKEITDDLNNYHIFEAARRLIQFIDELSTWYVRRSRDRFKSEGADKDQAIVTLGFVINSLIKVLAPFAPFVSERIYQRLNKKQESVHLEDWPAFDEAQIDKVVIAKMEKARKIIELGLAARDKAGIKVRQPLEYIRYQAKQLEPEYEQIIADELNVKEVKYTGEVYSKDGRIMLEEGDLKIALKIEISEELKLEGIVRELTRQINSLRRKQGLTMDDKVKLVYSTQGENLKKVFADNELVEKLKSATLLSAVEQGEAEQSCKVNEEEIRISLLAN